MSEKSNGKNIGRRDLFVGGSALAAGGLAARVPVSSAPPAGLATIALSQPAQAQA